MRFPLGELTKPEVREIAAAAGLPVASKRDSQDLCFLAGEGRRGFLARHGDLGDREGPIHDRAGRVLGRHRGQHNFTVGQRRGIGVATGEPLYVLETDAAANSVVVGSREQLATRTVALRDATLLRDATQVDAVKLRYRSKRLACTLEPSEAAAGRHNAITARLSEPAFGVAPGQVASLMRGDQIVGHATIAGRAD
jgi:tRNA-specific 2-thiouridylase